MQNHLEQAPSDISLSNNYLVPYSNSIPSDQQSLQNLGMQFYSKNISQAATGSDLFAVDLDTDGQYSDIVLFRAYNTAPSTLSIREIFLAPLRIPNTQVSGGADYFTSCSILVTDILSSLPQDNKAEIRSILHSVASAERGENTACYQLMNILVYGAPIVNFDSFQLIAAALLARIPDDIPETYTPLNQRTIKSFSWVYGLIPESIKAAIQQSVITTIQYNPGTTTAVCALVITGGAATLGYVTPIALLTQSTRFILRSAADVYSTPVSDSNSFNQGSTAWHLQEIANIVYKAFFGS
jgi:hypothetical protein